jgi:hypothetical protein
MWSRSLFLFGLFMLFLQGCIRQDVEITLDSDGSGTYKVKRYFNKMESQMANFGEYIVGEDLGGGGDKTNHKELTLLRHSSHKDAKNKADRYEQFEYGFESLSRALPILENEDLLMPRYFLEGDKIRIAIIREKSEADGGLSNLKDEKLFFNLTLNLPVPPVDAGPEKGTIKDHRVIWKFNHDEVMAFLKKPIGTILCEARVPADSLSLDFKARLVVSENKKRSSNLSKEKKEVIGLEKLDASISIPYSGKHNATCDLRFKTIGFSPPFSYEKLSITGLKVDGQKIEAELKSDSSGYVSGIDPQKNPIEGFPVSFKFALEDPWIKKIDEAKIEFQLVKPTSFKTVVLDCPVSGKPVPMIKDKGLRTVVAKVELGSSSAAWPEPQITMLTEIPPQLLQSAILETPYGLAYPMTANGWSQKTAERLWGDSEELAKKVFGEESSFYEVTFSTEVIPPLDFKIVLNMIESKELKPVSLVLENLEVPHESE